MPKETLSPAEVIELLDPEHIEGFMNCLEGGFDVPDAYEMATGKLFNDLIKTDSNISDDANLAQFLQAEEFQQTEDFQQTQSMLPLYDTINRDAIYAKELQEQEYQQQSMLSHEPPIDINNETYLMLELYQSTVHQLNPSIQRLSEIATPEKFTDIHTYTKEIGETINRDFLPVDTCLKLSKSDTTLQQILATIRDRARKIQNFHEEKMRETNLESDPNNPDEHCIAWVENALTSIQAKGDEYVEPETGLNMHDMLLRCGKLTAALGNRPEDVGLMVDVLRHNTQTKGGCDAGIAARLAIAYFQLIRERLVTAYNKLVKEITPSLTY